MEIGESDHRPVVTYMGVEREVPKRVFRFDSRMISKDGFVESVKRGWKGMGQAQLINIPLTQRISRCRQHISQWKRLNRNNTEEHIKIL